MKRTLCKVLATLVALALVMSFAAITAFAAYTPIDGGTTTDPNDPTKSLFKKHLVVDSDANIPNVNFTFSIDAGTAVAGGNGNALEILAGPVVRDATTNEVTAPTIAPATFSSDMTDITDGKPTDADPANPTAGKKYATSDIVIDLTGVTFSVPGVYRYVITEEANTFNGITNDDVATRYLDVFVFPNETDPTVLEVQNYSLRTAATNFERVEVTDPNTGDVSYKYQYTTDPGNKSDSYTNTLDTVDLEFAKKIEGNQADMTKRFEFTLELSDVNPGVYVLDFEGDPSAIIGDNDTVTANNGSYTITVPASGSDAGTYTGTFYLTNNDVVKVLNLNKKYNYKVTEAEQDYQKTDGVDNDGTDNDFTDSNVGNDITALITKTGYTNTREGAIPTGVILTVAPFAIGLLLFGAIMLYMVSKRRRAEY